MAFYPGQRVVCVKDCEARDLVIDPPVKGSVYTVRKTGVKHGIDMLWLEELMMKSAIGIWMAPHGLVPCDGDAGINKIVFRPLDENRLNVFRAMLAPKPKVRENSHA